MLSSYRKSTWGGGGGGRNSKIKDVKLTTRKNPIEYEAEKYFILKVPVTKAYAPKHVKMSMGLFNNKKKSTHNTGVEYLGNDSVNTIQKLFIGFIQNRV